MNIGSGFYNITENGTNYISISLDETILELYPNLQKVKFALNEIPANEQKENGPHYRLSMYKPKPKQ